MMQRQGTRKTLATNARHPVWIQVKQRTRDGEGGITEAWVNNQRVFAAVDPIKAVQRYMYNTQNVEATHLVRIRGLVNVPDETARIKFGSRTFEILTVENLQERNFTKVITCKERRYDG